MKTALALLLVIFFTPDWMSPFESRKASLLEHKKIEREARKASLKKEPQKTHQKAKVKTSKVRRKEAYRAFSNRERRARSKQIRRMYSPL